MYTITSFFPFHFIYCHLILFTIVLYFFLFGAPTTWKLCVLNWSSNSLTFIFSLSFVLHSGRFPELYLLTLLLTFSFVIFLNPQNCLSVACSFVDFSVPSSWFCVLVLSFILVALSGDLSPSVHIDREALRNWWDAPWGGPSLSS